MTTAPRLNRPVAIARSKRETGIDKTTTGDIAVKRKIISIVSSIAFVSVSGSSFGTQPTDPAGSDTAGNTAMGGSALASLVTSNNGTGGFYNTAAGKTSLFSTTSGSFNTALG